MKEALDELSEAVEQTEIQPGLGEAVAKNKLKGTHSRIPHPQCYSIADCLQRLLQAFQVQMRLRIRTRSCWRN